MPVFEYVALNSSGRQVKGTVDADSVRSARQKLRAQNVFPTDIRESLRASKEKSKDVKQLFKSDRVSIKQLATATRLLSTLHSAGLPLVSALLSLSEQVESPALKRTVVDIKERVEQGSSLNKALAQYPKVFPRLFINMIASGEASGTLDTVLENLADYYEGQVELRRRIVSALFYPCLMFIFCSLVVIGLVTFVVPSIVEIFVKQKLSLPFLTEMVVGLSHLITGYWWLLAGFVFAGISLVQYFYKQPKGRAWFDTLFLNLPLYGPIYRKISTARVASTLGTLISGGVELLNALDIVKNVVGNTHIKHALEEARDGVREGRSLAKELNKSKLFPDLLIQMVSIGEKSGRLEGMLNRAGKTFSGEANATIAGLTSLLEPIMLIVLGGVVGIIVIAMLLPMLDLMTMMNPAH